MKNILIIILILLSGNYTHAVKIQRMPKLFFEKEIKKIYIDPSFTNVSRDDLNLRKILISSLINKINQSGILTAIDSELKDEYEKVLLMSMSLQSSGESIDGIRTEFATCNCIGCANDLVGGLITSAASKLGDEDQGVSSHTVPAQWGSVVFMCTRPNIAKLASEYTLQKLGMGPIKDEVIRTYNFKNVSWYANASVEIFEISANERKQIMQLYINSTMKRHIQDKDSFVNVRAASQGYPLILPFISAVPVLPVPDRDIAVVEASNPGSYISEWIKANTSSPGELSDLERKTIVKDLVEDITIKLTSNFLPYDSFEVEVDDGGNKEAIELIKKRRFKDALELLKNSSSAPDLYNLGLTFEAAAKRVDDFKKSSEFYKLAYLTSPNIKYAEAFTRVNDQLRNFKK